MEQNETTYVEAPDRQELRPTDDKGRVDIDRLSDRELLEEIVGTMRFLADSMAEIQKQGIGGIMKGMLGGNGRG